MKNSLIFDAAVANDNLFQEKERALTIEEKSTSQHLKDKSDKTIAEYSRSGNAKAIGKMQKFFFKRQNEDALLGGFGRNATFILDAIFNTSQINLEKLKETATRFVSGFNKLSASQDSVLNNTPSFKAESVSVEFAAHVNNYIAKQVSAAPAAATNVLDKDASYMIPWAPNVAPLKASFHNGELTQAQAAEELQRSILDNNGIHTVDNGKEHFIKATKLYEMKDAFQGSTQNLLFNNTRINAFNDEARTQPETQQVFRFVPEAPRPSLLIPALAPVFGK